LRRAVTFHFAVGASGADSLQECNERRTQFIQRYREPSVLEAVGFPATSQEATAMDYRALTVLARIILAGRHRDAAYASA